MKIRILSVRLCLIMLLPVLALVSACNKASENTGGEEYIPVVKTNAILANVTATTAEAGGYLTNYISNTISSHGVCWSATNQKPTTSDSKTTLSNAPSGIYFGSSLTDLTANTTYYVRAYAVHTSGTYYGDVVQFKTLTTTGSVSATVSTFAGSQTAGFTNATGTAAAFNSPQGLIVDATGNLYVADAFNNAIRKITPAGVVTTFAGASTPGFTDGTGTAARFYSPTGLATDGAGNIYVADQGNNAIRKITTAGVVTTLAGGSAGYLDATTGTTARFNGPTGLAVDANGNVYVADKGNNVIRKVASTGAVTTLSGIRTAGFVDGENTIAKFNGPTSLVYDGTANLYVVDSGSGAIRKVVVADGSVGTYFGNPTQSTLLGQPKYITRDAAGNFFITDTGGRLLQITAGNIMRSLAGTSGVSGFANGAGTAAKFDGPQGVAVDAAGNIYIADINNNQIRKAVITTVP